MFLSIYYCQALLENINYLFIYKLKQIILITEQEKIHNRKQHKAIKVNNRDKKEIYLF